MKPATADLPRVTAAEVDAVVDYLQSFERTQRRPEATAKLLVLAVKLHQKHVPWPSRPAVAAHLDVSLPLVDVAISQRRAQGIIKVVIETTQGHVRKRPSVITHRYIEPSPSLVEAVEKAATPAAGRARRKVTQTA